MMKICSKTPIVFIPEKVPRQMMVFNITSYLLKASVCRAIVNNEYLIWRKCLFSYRIQLFYKIL